jgi:hypothetical protein
MKLYLTLLGPLALLIVACASGTELADPGAGARWSDTPNQTLLNQLPAYSGATLVREWQVTQANEEIHVREYAVAIPAEQAVDQVTLYFRAWLLQNGWTETQPRAAFAAYSKERPGGGITRFIIRRVGPQIMEPPAAAQVISRADPPAGTGFFYTLEMTADWKGSPPR